MKRKLQDAGLPREVTKAFATGREHSFARLRPERRPRVLWRIIDSFRDRRLDREMSAPPQFPAFELVTDVSEGEWIRERLRNWPREGGLRVWSIVPSGFEAYARVFHPASIWKGRDDGAPPDVTLVPWKTVAAWSGQTIVPGTDWATVATRADGARWTREGGGSSPADGLPPADLCAALAQDLAPHTTDPTEARFAMWDGWGHMQWPPEVPRLELPARTYVLYRGHVEAVTTFGVRTGGFQAPSLWWPADRSWCVASEIDFRTTFVGGSRQAIGRILDDPRLETMAVAEQDLAEVGDPRWDDP
jgi:hypothetical protein